MNNVTKVIMSIVQKLKLQSLLFLSLVCTFHAAQVFKAASDFTFRTYFFKMRVYKKTTALKADIAQLKSKGLQTGFVPTMGALHQGHLKLVETSLAQNDITIVSIFVNPTQFNNKEDLIKYPRTEEKDIQLLHNVGCNILFLPEVEEMYPANESLKNYDLSGLEDIYEGAFRPGHFQGVCQIVDKLFQIVQPHHVYFGQKDYQQCMVIKRLINLTPSHQQIQMHLMPTVREENGLAMSSRNLRLNKEALQKAPTLFQALQFIKENIQPGAVQTILQQANKMLISKGFRPEYISIANSENLKEIAHWDGDEPMVALAAAFLDEVRLIDNLVLHH